MQTTCSTHTDWLLLERKMLLHFSAQICPIVYSLLLVIVLQWVFLRDCAHEPSLLEKKVNIINLFFQLPVYVHNHLYKCRPLITFEKKFRPVKIFLRECVHVQSHISLRCSRGKCYISFTVPILSLIICY